MKPFQALTRYQALLSLPARGVWIETYEDRMQNRFLYGHSPQGECGLKLLTQMAVRNGIRVTPRKGSVD